MLIKLYKIPFLDFSYTNVIDFKSLSDRASYFNNLPQTSVTTNAHYDTMRELITVKKNVKDILQYDYLSFTDESGKDLFYFIVNKEHQTADTCILHVQIDVFTTYQFDVTYYKSYIDRCHVPRWSGSIPTHEVVDEGFNFDNYVLYGKDKITSLTNNYIMTTTSPLGNTDSSSGGGSGGSGSMANGVMSANGFVFIKGYEAFSDYGLYLNNESFKTVGYGFTETHNPTEYEKHKPFPVSEARASELFANSLINNYGKRIYDSMLDNNIQGKISIHQFDAMCSLAWNRGVNGFLNDPTSPWQKIKANPYDSSIGDTWKAYAITSNGNPLEGLRLRRIAEYNIYSNAVYEFRRITQYTDNGQGLGIAVNNGYVTDNDGKGFIPSIFNEKLSGTGSYVVGNGGQYMIPCVGTVTATWHSYYNELINYWHDGIDIASPEGTPIYSARSGYVKRVTDLGSEAWGLYVDIQHDDGSMTRYAHCSKVLVDINDQVKEGQHIADVGNTGTSTGAHLHWGVYQNNTAIDFDINDKLIKNKIISYNMGVI